MKVVFQTEDGKIFENRDEAAEYENKNLPSKSVEVWVLNMPGTKYDGIQVVKKVITIY